MAVQDAKEEAIISATRRLIAVEQDVASRERDLAVREDDVVRRRAQLKLRREELERLRRELASEIKAATTNAPRVATAESMSTVPVRAVELPPLARTTSTLVHRIYLLLETEGRLWTAGEVADRLDLPSTAVDSVRTALSKMHARGLVARRAPGKYCSRMFDDEAFG